MRYGSVCSGIEAASVAWEPLGMTPVWFSEFDAFPSAVLAHHWPHVDNLGDMTKLPKRVLQGEIEAPDVLVGGTPCQAFSVAGLREGMADERGQLTIKYVELLDAIDTVRVRAGKPAAIAVWENVPGVLSDKNNAFGCFLGALAGEDRELQPSGKKWTNAGCVYGPQRAVAWRVLDAQYFGVAQRRRRVFVVASARDGFDPAAVLFERESVRRDTAPRREAGQDAAADAGKGTVVTSADVAPALLAKGNSSHRTDAEAYVAAPMKARDYKDVTAFGQNRQSGPVETSHALSAHSGPHGRLDFASETFLVQAGHGDQFPHVSHALSVRRLTPTECERLQGFPDNHTRIPWRGKTATDCPDGPRYKAVGNSMAVPVMRWIGARIQDSQGVAE